MKEARTIYTVGYQCVSLDEIERAIEDTNSVLIDVRYMPASRMPQFSRKRLSERFGPRYLWVKGFGNVNYKNGGPIEFFDLEFGIEEVRSVLETHSIMLMCQCPNLDQCHRKPLSEHLAKTFGLEVEHIGGKPRQQGAAPLETAELF